ncbi:hypothetical protein KUTeg_014184 [Tegillarca granosa]|uniref:Bardet-Biedl syndrome 1 n=1 Tax=Tegillarca granosa TaxID=220873 RepID=A0ABQ9EZM9_TEGGR|nr:hypothetical protein KUTeg_014184 [Tegillarca granosa]
MATVTTPDEAPEEIVSGGNDKWLDAYHDPVASLYTMTQCIALSDIQADGDWKLVIADLGTGSYNMKLKVYKAIAVASGPYIYVYKNLKPYFKFTLPTLEVNPIEMDLWGQVRENKINIFVLREMLEGMRSEGVPLTVRSLRYLQLTDVADFEAFVNLYKNAPLRRQTVITCLSTLKKSMADEDAISCLVLGTESKSVYVLDPEAFTVLTTGKKLWTVKLPANITTIETMEYNQKGFKAVIVALDNCQVHIYKEKYLVNVIKTQDVVTGLKFGRFGREDGTLIMTTRGGGLLIKIMKRNAVFQEKDISAGPPAAQNQKLNVPKKTKLFVDQTMRERENAVTMHRTFQRDLYLLRLNTAREYVKALENSMNPISSDPTEPLKLSAQVQGIGPTFKLTVNLQNTSLSQPSTDLLITFQFDDKLYLFRKTFIQVPMLVPGLSYAFDTFIECLSDKGVSDNVKVFVLKEGKSVPIITGVISMPVSESVVVV